MSYVDPTWTQVATIGIIAVALVANNYVDKWYRRKR